MKHAIAFDFDGVIHKYRNGWQDGSIYDEADQEVVRLMLRYMRAGYPVFIFSTRSPRQIERWITNFEISGIPEFDDMVPFNEWVPVRKIPFWKKFWNKTGVLGITKRKLPAAHYVDDRAVLFTGDIEDLKSKLPKLD